MPPETLATEGGLAMDALTFPADLPDPANGFLDFTGDLAIPPDLDVDLELDLDSVFEFDPSFSPDDLLDFSDFEGDPVQTYASACGPSDVSPPQITSSSEFSPGVSPQEANGTGKLESGVSMPQETGSTEFGSGVSSSSPSPGNIGTEDFESGNSATCSAGRSCYATGSPDSGSSARRAAGAECVKSCGLKRKSERDDDPVDGNPNSVSKLPWQPLWGGGDTSSHPSIAGTEEDDKRKARLIRNRESAQLSRQRKKLYVEELEEKVKVMNATIGDLNNRISYFMAENASLRKQLSSGSARNSSSPPPTAMYPVVHPMAPQLPYPWMPWPGCAVTPGSQVPLVPIPKLRTQQPVSTAKTRERKKGVDSKTKKVASVSLVGLLFFMLVLGAFVPSIRRSDSTGHNYSKDGGSGQYRETVLAVTRNSEDSRFCRGNVDCDKTKGYPAYLKGAAREPERHEETSLPGNASEPLLASLYVPRNDKLVKIDGNLIISSVLSSEKARAQINSAVDADKTGQISGNTDKETSLAITGDMFSALAVVGPERVVESLSSRYGQPAGEHHKTQEWFHEGLEGPIFRSGMCTEVFQFDASLAPTNKSGLVPAASIVNSMRNETMKSPSTRNMRNRRILSPHPMQLAGYALNDSNHNTKKGFSQASDKSSFSNTTDKPIIVSVLVDPREGRDIDGLLSPKSSISRIFVVVLVDSVKYITYSCMLPHKSNVHHLVTV